MRHRLAAAAALTSFLGGDALAESPLGRVTVLEATTSLDVLAGMAFGAETVGSAEARFEGAWPEFRFPVEREDGPVIEHSGGLRLYTLDDPSVDTVLWGLAVDAEAGRVTGTVDGVPGVTLFRTAAASGADALILVISPDLAAVLSGVFGAPDLGGVPLGRLSITSEAADERPAVPIPPGQFPLRPPWPEAEPEVMPLGR